MSENLDVPEWGRNAVPSAPESAAPQGERPTVNPVIAKAVVGVGALASIASAFLAWTWTPNFPGDLSVSGYPGGNQWITLVTGVMLLIATAAAFGVPGLRWLTPRGYVRLLQGLALANLASTWYVLIAIVVELKGIANFVTGSWVAGIATLIPVLGAFLLIDDKHEAAKPARTPRWLQIAVIFVAVVAGMFVADYGISTGYAEEFLGFAFAIGFAAWGLASSGVLNRLTGFTAANRAATAVAAFVAALIFVFAQTTDQYNNLADDVLILATVALGLNIVVGLAGLLDLGYVAFLGVGSYTAALVSGTAASRFHVAYPFWAQVLLGIAVALIAGVIIGAPTLRLRGDYLAIVTLGFGEIFRIVVNNLNGQSGPNLTNGPEGVYGVPDLTLFGYKFDKAHQLFGVTFNKFGNYYLLLVVAIAIVIFIFARVNDSRIGRAWVAIREDETAAGAMGINGFRFKLLAFALGAGLAGFAGTINAHILNTVTPDQYMFSATSPPNSAFLLAAVVLGGMGTISGPLLGAALLYLIPFKLQFFHNKQLLLFGLALILMMRFRPEGLVPSRRRQLEFHDEQIAEAEAQQAVLADVEEAGATA
ncbi:MAG: branched-chain amino acid ABC transporter permease [Actinocrinis sp.]